MFFLDVIMSSIAFSSAQLPVGIRMLYTGKKSSHNLFLRAFVVKFLLYNGESRLL